MHEVSSWQGCYRLTLKLRNRPEFGSRTFLDTPHCLMQWLQKHAAAKNVVIFTNVIMKHKWRSWLTSKPTMEKFILCIPWISYPNQIPCPSFDFTVVQIPSVVNEPPCFSLSTTTKCSFNPSSDQISGTGQQQPKTPLLFLYGYSPVTNFAPHNGTEKMSVT